MKRKHFFLGTFIISIFFFCACNSESPKDVALNFLVAKENSDYETAKKYANEETKTRCNNMIKMISSLPDSVRKKVDAARVAAGKISITIKEVKETGDKATVTYFITEHPEETNILKLEKNNGHWQANEN